MIKQEFCYSQLNDLQLSMTFYAAETLENAKATILYFHGGGLIYGDRDDLPQKYRTLLVENGYQLLTIDYPLAPEAKLATINECLEQAIDWFLANYQTKLGLSKPDYFLFGRSAGGYLAYLLSARCPKAEQKGLISFYGYYDLTADAFNQPSSYYNQFAKVTPLAAQAMIRQKMATAISINERFSLYLSGRQFGNWLSYLVKSPDEKTTFSLTETELKSLPPAFLTHSAADQDVPVAISRKASELLADASYEEVEKLPHDFDSDLTNDTGLKVYQSLVQWLDRQMTDKG
ncbi:alpha/beta hydrolase [Enterococcus sp. UD-01]|jgi:acetyl esterase|uniref:alpha/beta hydrolase n=1 Tax=Enterococcus sp. UD-01 TaxID=3373911 RepID=UPI003837616D